MAWHGTCYKRYAEEHFITNWSLCLRCGLHFLLYQMHPVVLLVALFSGLRSSDLPAPACITSILNGHASEASQWFIGGRKCDYSVVLAVHRYKRGWMGHHAAQSKKKQAILSCKNWWGNRCHWTEYHRKWHRKQKYLSRSLPAVLSSFCDPVCPGFSIVCLEIIVISEAVRGWRCTGVVYFLLASDSVLNVAMTDCDIDRELVAVCP